MLASTSVLFGNARELIPISEVIACFSWISLEAFQDVRGRLSHNT